MLFLGREPAAGDRPAGRVLQVGAPARQRRLVGLHPDDRQTRAGEDLGDARPHRAEPGDPNSLHETTS